MWVDLEHVRYPQAGKRRLQRRNMLAVVGGDDGLCVGSLEEPAFPHPGGVEVRYNALKMREVQRHYLFFAHLEQRVIHRAVVAQVDQVSSTVLARRTEVGMLKQAGERIAPITDVDPVAIGQGPI